MNRIRKSIEDDSKKPDYKSRLKETAGIIMTAASIFLFLSLVSYDPIDWPGSSRAFDEPYRNLVGWMGAFVSYNFLRLFGYSSYAFFLLLALAGGIVFFHRKLRLLLEPGIFLIIAGLFVPLLFALGSDNGSDNTRMETGFHYGGVLGGLFAHFMVTYAGKAGSYIVAISAILVTVVMTTNLRPSSLIEAIAEFFKPFFFGIAGLFSGKKDLSKKKPVRLSKKNNEIIDEDIPGDLNLPPMDDNEPFLTPIEEEPEPEEENALPLNAPTINIRPFPQKKETPPEQSKLSANDDEFKPDALKNPPRGEYILPDTNLLDEISDIEVGETKEEMLEQAQRLMESLKHFNIDSEVRQITPGPIVTRYELTLAPGVKVGRILGLSNDLAMALRAKGGIRILAPIPGKAAVGIEVPNKNRSTVYFREIAESETFMNSDGPLVLAVGKTTSGEPAVADLAKMPHLLIAGSTGSGKSVCIHSIVASILLRAKPDQVKMLMIDPKMVELSIYNDIPHLITSVITDPKRAAGSLKWAVREMENRYRKLASIGVRDIYQYNEKVRKMLASPKTEADGKDSRSVRYADHEPLPLMVLVIDEFADLMVVASNEIEESIARLAQMARAVGMHLILATQRPSADVITGLIKANFPSRIAFKVMQASNSRIILDEGGADKLLGMGDMLFLQAGKPESVRMHGAFISNDECGRIVDFITAQSGIKHDRIDDSEFIDDEEETDNPLGMRDMNDKDALFYDAARLVVRHNQGSVSLLQRRLKIGYARAARLIDQLEMAGVVSPYDGSKAREVLVDELYIEELENGDMG